MQLLLQLNLVILVSAFAHADVFDSSHPEVNTTSGLVIGTTHPESHSFYSIPYGQAPVGELRFKAPLPVTYQGSLNCSFPDYVRCYEPDDCFYRESECEKNYNEDCLVLNVFVPSTVDLSPSGVGKPLLPVMFWIHGGAFSFGAGTDIHNDGQQLANTTNTVVVAINYRLNALGFLTFDRDGNSLEGNQGLKDQQLALQWMHDNIEQFGGDKNKVTVFGQSSGAQSIMLLLMSRKSSPLFKRAIIQSNPAFYHYTTKTEALKVTDTLLKHIGCTEDHFQCLRNVDAGKLMSVHFPISEAQTNQVDAEEPYRPILDEDEFTQQPLAFFMNEMWKVDKDIIIGTTSDEMAFIKVQFGNEILTKENFILETVKYAGEEFGLQAAKHYIQRSGADDSGNFDFTDTLAQLLSDMVFTCPNRAVARVMSSSAATFHPRGPASNVYLYVYDYRVDADNCEEIYPIFNPVYCYYASHGTEVPYLFNSGAKTGLALNENGSITADLMNKFWGNFAHYGRPSNDVKVWPPYTEKSLNNEIQPWTNVRILPPNSYVEESYRSEICDFWDSLNIYVNLTSISRNRKDPDRSGSVGIHTDKFSFFVFSLIIGSLLL